MSVPNRRKRRVRIERSGIQLTEESFHLLRSLDLRYFWIFYLGAIPFAVGLLYFTADMGRGGVGDRSVLWTSLVLTLLYFWMRICQGLFCKGLWETLSPFGVEQKSRWTTIRETVALCCFQAFYLPWLFLGFLFLLPLGWIVAALQNAPVLAYTQAGDGREFRRLFSSCFRHSHVDWAQNHGILIVLFFVGLFTWVNLLATAIVLPTLAKSFFGIESVFTISPAAAIGNSTFFLGTLILTWLVLSPMLKAVYALRCFYTESRTTGADLMSRLAHCEQSREREFSRTGSSLAKASSTVILASVFFASSVHAEEGVDRSTGENPETARAVSVEIDGDRLQEEIAETLEQKKYQWQLSKKEIEGATPDQEETWLSRRMRELADSVRESVEAFTKWLREMWEEWTGGREIRPRSGNSGDFRFAEGLSSTLSIGLIILVSVLVAWLAFLMYRKYRGKAPVEAKETRAEAVDLQSEDIVASQLPEEEWMRLAKEQIEKGDRRLALRALFLASLANLGEVGLLRIARFKSNRMYREELARKARKQKALRNAFERNIDLFERAWYGWHPVAEETVDEFLRNHRTIGEESGKAPGATSRELEGLPDLHPA